MARIEARLAENVPGDFYVDSSCIDCDTCRHVASATFRRSDAAGASVVVAQPTDGAAERRALMALVACPTASIGFTGTHDARAAARAFPEPITPDGRVLYCGYTSESSYGASSYLILRPEGNVLVDSPRAAGPLLERLAALGGVATLFLTHRDDVADHEKLRARFSCERILHRADVSLGTRGVERLLEGTEPIALAPDLLAIPVPGHTRGSVALLFEERVLFTGDHLWADETGALGMGQGVCWYSWPEQVRSLGRLRAHRFDTILPGHERRASAPSVEAMRARVAALHASLGGA